MLKNYFIVCFRNLWRNKAFSFINIIGLSVGLACCMLIFLYAKDELSYDRFHQNKDKLYRIVATSTAPEGTVQRIANTGMMPGPSFKANIPEISDFLRLQSDGYTVKLGTQVFYQDVLDVDENFFSVFSFPLLKGNPKTALADLHSVVISEDIAKKYFGRKEALGQVFELKVNDKFVPFTVSGVAKNSPQNSSIPIGMLLPMKFRQSMGDDKHWANFFLNTFVVIHPGSNTPAIEAKFDKIYNDMAASEIKEMAEKFGDKSRIRYFLQPFMAIHLSTDFIADNGMVNNSNPTYSYILSGISLFILIIACINFVNLTISRSLKRGKEIGIRKVVGSQRKQLILQFLGESYILCFIAFVTAIALVQLLLPFFNHVSNKALAFSYLLDGKLIIGYIALFLLTGLLAGFYPALVLSGFNPVDTLYGRIRFGGKNYLSRSLVVLQFTLATFLIIATMTIYSQFNFLMHFDLGYDDKNVAVVNTDQLDRNKYELFKNELLRNSNIQWVSADQGGQWVTHAHVNGAVDIMFDFKIVDENFFPLFKIPVVKGRNFSATIASDSAQGVVVSESFAKTAGWKDPLGQIVDFFYINKKYTVIGVTRDYQNVSLNDKVDPQIFITNPGYHYGRVYMKLKTGSAGDALPHIAAVYKKLFPLSPYQYSFKDDENAKQYESEAKWKQIIGFGALLTIFISAIGLFGLATLSAEKRTKEIGIRKVLGASVLIIVKKLSADFVRLVLLAALIATPAAWWAMNKWLDNYQHRVGTSWWTFGIAALLVLFIALVTLSFQVIKAAIANPAKSLRTE